MAQRRPLAPPRSPLTKAKQKERKKKPDPSLCCGSSSGAALVCSPRLPPPLLCPPPAPRKGVPTVFDPSYKGVGQTPGLEIWRVEKLAVVKKAASDKAYKGHLHEGDSYIILQTKVRRA